MTDFANRSLEVIVRLTERCNIDCSYCYVFKLSDRSFERHPAILTREAADALPQFLAQAVEQLNLDGVTVYLQGGEPLLAGAERTADLCRRLRSRVAPLAETRIAVATNAMLIDDAWLDVFSEFGIHVAVSLDGPRETNDISRRDKKGRGTYERSVVGLRRVQAASSAGRLPRPSIMSVISPGRSPAQAYRHFVDDLGATSLHFQLPDATWDSINRPSDEAVSRSLRELFVEWSRRDIGRVWLRIASAAFDAVVKPLASNCAATRSFAVTVASNGDLGPPDDWRNFAPALFETGLNVGNCSAKEFLQAPSIRSAFDQIEATPQQCGECVWRPACRGGNIANPLHRFGRMRGFLKPSIYCRPLQSLFQSVVEFLLDKGVPFEVVERNIAGNAGLARATESLAEGARGLGLSP